jgi:hypothetical protein
VAGRAGHLDSGEYCSVGVAEVAISRTGSGNRYQLTTCTTH